MGSCAAPSAKGDDKFITTDYLQQCRYYNMREKVVEHPHILDIAQQAMRDCHITPEMKPIRGGTDGAQLSFMGLPCPNLFTGGYNYHGKHEFVTLEGMEKAVQVIVRIAELTAKRGQ